LRNSGWHDAIQLDFKRACRITIARSLSSFATVGRWRKLRPNKKTLNLNDFLAELKRRNDVRMPGLYSRLFVQLAGTLLPAFDAGNIR
jgi:hypothetical protein